MKWGIAFGVVLLAAAAWPADAPPVCPPEEPEPEAIAGSLPAPEPVPAAPGKPGADRRNRQRDPGDPQPPPEPPPPPPRKPLGTVSGNVEDETGGAIHAYRINGRRYGHRGRRSSGQGAVGPAGTFTFAVHSLNFGPPEIPPGCEPDRSLFSVWADGYVGKSFPMSDDVESALHRNERVTGVRIVLERAVIVEGRLFLPNGHPSPAHWLGVYRRKPNGNLRQLGWAKTDGNGWYRFPSLRPEPNLFVHASATRRKPDRIARSPYLPVGDDPVGGEIVHVDVRLGPWVPKK